MAAVKVVQVLVEEIDSERFRRTLRASGLSAAALGRKAGVHKQYVSRLQRGLIQEVEIETFNALLDAMADEGEFEGRGRDDVLAFIRGRASFELVPGTPWVPNQNTEAQNLQRVFHANAA